MKKITLMLTLALSCFLAQSTLANADRKKSIRQTIESCLRAIDEVASYGSYDSYDSYEPNRSLPPAMGEINSLIDRTYRKAQSLDYGNYEAHKAYKKAIKKLEKTKKHLHKASYKHDRKDVYKQIEEAKECFYEATEYLDRAEYYTANPSNYRRHYDYD